MMFMVVDRPGKKTAQLNQNALKLTEPIVILIVHKSNWYHIYLRFSFRLKCSSQLGLFMVQLSKKTELNHNNSLEVLNWTVSYTPNWTELD